MVPLPGLPPLLPLLLLLLAPATERVGVFPDGGRLALRAAEVARDLVEELRAFEALADSTFALVPLGLMVRELMPDLMWPSLLPLVVEDGGEITVGVEDEVGMPRRGTILLDLLVPPKLAPLFSLDRVGLDPTDVRLSHRSRDTKLPKYLPLSPLPPLAFRLEDVLKLDVLKLAESPLS